MKMPETYSENHKRYIRRCKRDKILITAARILVFVFLFPSGSLAPASVL